MVGGGSGRARFLYGDQGAIWKISFARGRGRVGLVGVREAGEAGEAVTRGMLRITADYCGLLRITAGWCEWGANGVRMGWVSDG